MQPAKGKMDSSITASPPAKTAVATVKVDREAVLAGFSSVEDLNREAEVSNAALQAILEKSATDSGEAAFEQFCLQLHPSIKTLFGHFRTVRPQLAKMRHSFLGRGQNNVLECGTPSHQR